MESLFAKLYASLSDKGFFMAAELTENYRRTKWACRRGMLELDLLLLPFIENHYTGLTVEEQSEFQRMLTASDPELNSWLMGHTVPEDHKLQQIVTTIREST